MDELAIKTAIIALVLAFFLLIALSLSLLFISHELKKLKQRPKFRHIYMVWDGKREGDTHNQIRFLKGKIQPDESVIWEAVHTISSDHKDIHSVSIALQ